MNYPATRADARRSRRLLIEAGTRAFIEHGIDVQVSEITRRAGLAKGTFFRHFPTKHDLLAAILTEMVQRQTEIVEALLAEDGDHLIERYMVASGAEMAPLRSIIEATMLRRLVDPTISEAMGVFMEKLGVLLSEAQARGEVRGDITPLEVYTLVLAATSSSGHFLFRDYPEFWRRQLAVTLDGLRPAAAGSLPGEAPPYRPATTLAPEVPDRPGSASRRRTPR
ncbi:MAG: TetR/AcrR family transcriptional regulator [Solirubrobacterales bacterium]|nr:TetR/AcrR family transcriptional regulator [Solirubrobacterales bacterium]